MSNVRRWYVYLISVISLQAVTWAIIALLRNLLVFDINPLAIAFQIAMIIIGFPVYLAHWYWVQRLTNRSVDERGATLRRIYLYGNMAAFLVPFLTNTFDMFRAILGGLNQLQSFAYTQLPLGKVVIYHIVAMILLFVLWLYHQRVVAEDARVIPETGSSATVRRLYVLGFSAAGLTLTVLAVIHLIRWLMLRFGSGFTDWGGLNPALTNEITRLIVGLPLWLVFWQWAQQLFDNGSEEERLSALRKFYLFGVVFIGALCVVTNVTGILAGLLRHLLSLTPSGDLNQPIPIIIGTGILWAYHSHVLHVDASHGKETTSQVGVRRLYQYLIAAIGLSALLVGMSGDTSVILRAVTRTFGTGLREEFAWFTAAIVAGFPLWFLPWRRVQGAATDSWEVGKAERVSIVRKIYLYFFLFLATLTLLSSTVYIVYRIISMLLGEPSPTLSELGQAISFLILATFVWLYHGSVLRNDSSISRHEQAELLDSLRVVVMDIEDGRFGDAISKNLKDEYPGISLQPIVLASQKIGAAESTPDQQAISKQLMTAGLILGPWMIAIPGSAGGAVDPDIATAVISSPARKVLVPYFSEGWDWAGVDRMDFESIIRHSVRAIKQILSGEEVKAHQPMSVGTILAIIIGLLFLMIALAIPLMGYFL